MIYRPYLELLNYGDRMRKHPNTSHSHLPSELLIWTACGILKLLEALGKQDKTGFWKGGAKCKT